MFTSCCLQHPPPCSPGTVCAGVSSLSPPRLPFFLRGKAACLPACRGMAIGKKKKKKKKGRRRREPIKEVVVVVDGGGAPPPLNNQKVLGSARMIYLHRFPSSVRDCDEAADQPQR